MNDDPISRLTRFNGVILTDQIKNLDGRARRIDIVGKAPNEVVIECLDKIHTFL